mmetsp:Transcript_420/g.638  ORF Transcript_420/g.638 Transcript_420/m.638 type:complete len:251 (+) Transcript_420:52-804(+)
MLDSIKLSCLRTCDDSVPELPSPMPSVRRAKSHGVPFPQEYLLDQFLRNVSNRHDTWDTHVAACNWTGVECDGTKQVARIQWAEHQIGGYLVWEHLPASLTDLILSHNLLVGSISLGSLPRELQCLDVCHNHLTGWLDLILLPYAIEKLDVSHNAFSGSLSLVGLPAKLRCLNFSDNRFSKEVDLSSLPDKLECLCLQNNEDLFGEAFYDYLPATLSDMSWDSGIQDDFEATYIKICEYRSKRQEGKEAT